jgi:hypothetical protein
MSANSNGQSIVHAGAPITALNSDHPMCKAFCNAVKGYCRKKLGKRGTFNDYFFKKLARQSPTLAKEMQREVPFLFKHAAGGPQLLGTAAEVAKNGAGIGQEIAEAMHAVGSPMTGAAVLAKGATGLADAFRGSCAAAWKGVTGAGANRFFPKFPDAMRNGQAIEIKGPGDSFRGNQKACYQKISKPHDLLEVDCESCSTEECKCKSGPKPKGMSKKEWNGGCG